LGDNHLDRSWSSPSKSKVAVIVSQITLIG
jgi:hypothetical protein